MTQKRKISALFLGLALFSFCSYWMVPVETNDFICNVSLLLTVAGGILFMWDFFMGDDDGKDAGS